MLKYAKIENEETKEVSVALGTNMEFYKLLGMNELDVEKGKDGRWYLTGYAPRQSFEEAKAAKLAEINSACDSILKEAVKTYPDTEVMTFDQQVKEAEAYKADPDASVALLASLASARGIELPELVARVMAKHEACSVLSGAVIGQRQALEDKLDACASVEEVNALVINIAMPS